MSRPGAVLLLLSAALACAGRPPPGVPGEGLPAEAAFVRDVYAFPVLDETGRPYHHPFLGGYNLPRPQWVDIDGDGVPDLFLQEASGRIVFFEGLSPGEEALRADGRPLPEWAGGPGPGPAAAGSGGSATGNGGSAAGDGGTAAEDGGEDWRASLPRYIWRTDRFADLEVGEWFRFADLFGDGTYDLLAEEKYSYIRLYRNVGTPREPRFVLAADSLRDVDGKPIFSDRQNIPNVADIDCDGRLDLLVGRLVGTITRYEEADRDADGLPRFRLVTDRFENIEIIGQIGTLHGANTLALADVDGDGDPDLFWGDFFEPGLLLIENTGSCPNPSFTGEPVPFPPHDPLSTSGYNAPTFADADGNGNLDLLVGVIGGAFNPNRTSVENLYFLEQLEDGRFVERTRRFLSQIDVGSESVPALVDLDGNGLLDLVVGNKIEPEDSRTARMYVFRNEGTPREPRFRLTGTLAIEGSYHYAPAFGDLTGNGLPDLLLGSWRDEIAYYRNVGTREEPRFELVDPAFVKITRGSNTTPALADLEGNGLLDLVIGEGSGTLNFYRNVGTPEEPRFELVSDEWLGINVGRRSVPAFVDLGGNGLPDLVVGSASSGLILYRNMGTRRGPRYVRDDAFPFPEVPGLAAPAFGDIDGDGNPDLFLGTVGGGLLFFENRGEPRLGLAEVGGGAAGPAAGAGAHRSERSERRSIP